MTKVSTYRAKSLENKRFVQNDPFRQTGRQFLEKMLETAYQRTYTDAIDALIVPFTVYENLLYTSDSTYSIPDQLEYRVLQNKWTEKLIVNLVLLRKSTRKL